MSATILLVEDDAHFAAGLRYNLERAGYEVAHAADGTAGLALALDHAPDIVLLDLTLPGLPGYALLAKLRAAGKRMPVIILSALDQEADKIRCLDVGADDYLAKPFGVGELLARIRARLRPPDGTSVPERFAVGRAMVLLDELAIEVGDVRTALTPTEVEILRVLRSRAGKPAHRDDLLREIWGAAAATTRTLDTHVNRLRRKIEDDPARPRHLVTVHGVGYRLVTRRA
jgi:DNA-binding response OmpR family regulator